MHACAYTAAYTILQGRERDRAFSYSHTHSVYLLYIPYISPYFTFSADEIVISTFVAFLFPMLFLWLCFCFSLPCFPTSGIQIEKSVPDMRLFLLRLV